MEEPALPRPRRGAALSDAGREDLDLYSIEELQERLDQLDGEIARTRGAMDRKRTRRTAADALFSFSKD